MDKAGTLEYIIEKGLAGKRTMFERKVLIGTKFDTQGRKRVKIGFLGVKITVKYRFL